MSDEPGELFNRFAEEGDLVIVISTDNHYIVAELCGVERSPFFGFLISVHVAWGDIVMPFVAGRVPAWASRRVLKQEAGSLRGQAFDSLDEAFNAVTRHMKEGSKVYGQS